MPCRGARAWTDGTFSDVSSVNGAQIFCCVEALQRERMMINEEKALIGMASSKGGQRSRFLRVALRAEHQIDKENIIGLRDFLDLV